jgi:hypothetical protein
MLKAFLDMLCFSKCYSISSLPVENLPFKLSVTLSTSFSVTGNINIVLGQQFIFYCDIWQLKLLLFWVKSSSAVPAKKGFSISVTNGNFIIISVLFLSN